MTLTTLLALQLALAPPPAAEDPTARVLTQLLIVELGKQAELEVLSDRDVNRVLELEKQRAVMGCDDADACLAELADAMGARLVVYGDLSRVGDRLFLAVNLFDSDASKAVGRVLFKGPDLASLESQVEEKLRAQLLEGQSFPPDTRLMVLELKAAGETTPTGAPPTTAAPTPPPAEGGLGWVWISSGAALTVVGLAVATPSVLVPVLVGSEEEAFKAGDEAALQRATRMQDLWYGELQLAPLGAVAGGVLIAAGVGVMTLGFLE